MLDLQGDAVGVRLHRGAPGGQRFFGKTEGLAHQAEIDGCAGHFWPQHLGVAVGGHGVGLVARARADAADVEPGGPEER